MSLTPAQQSRVAAYRKHKTPESLSDSQMKQNEALVGDTYPVPMMRGGKAVNNYFASVNQTPRRSGEVNAGYAAPNPQTTPVGGFPKQQQTRGFSDLFPPPPDSAAFTDPSDGGHGRMMAARLNGAPPDLTNYILQLEQQNQELRRYIDHVQSTKRHHGSEYIGGEDEKKMFLNDVLSQLEIVIQAHRNKTAAEIQKYKTEAENANMALRNLRNAIQQEGMDLSLAPAMISFSRKLKDVGGGGSEATRAASTPLALPPESQQLLDAVANEILQKLVEVKHSEDVPSVVQTSVKSSFEAIVLHFTDQLVQNYKESDNAVETLKSEVTSLREELRTQTSINESQRIRLVQESEIEMQALRDQLRAFQSASAGGDEVAMAVNERALEEYTHMLIESRSEVNHLRQELDNEKNHSAQVCLKLKAALQKRNAEFEKAVVSRAEDVVQQRERWIQELERRLRGKEGEGLKEFRDFGCQAGDPSLTLPSQENFVSNVMNAVRRDPARMNNPQNKEIFEKEVWRKTTELLSKYSNRSS